MELFNKVKKYVLIAIPIILLIVFCFLYQKEEKEGVVAINNDYVKEVTTTKKESNGFYIDIKGAVKKPGVYLVHENDKVVDAIKMAGGLTKSAVTNNINLSQKLKSEMVIYIFTKKELTPETTKMITTTACKCETIKVDNCINQTTTPPTTTRIALEEPENGKININTVSELELTSLNGIGEAKAKAIIDYRNNNGLFKTIEDIKNVPGLGESIFAKIKDNITV